MFLRQKILSLRFVNFHSLRQGDMKHKGIELNYLSLGKYSWSIERGWPRNTWWQELEAETKQMGYKWHELEKAQKRDDLVDGLCSRRGTLL